eukprot:CAMPEP_0117420924 /NCGR_PEP_ID=MMETSP0758-20121206/2155_1 /TAXON_ID=63605 /ORGANISM="Percolomonas cosmopolitus, Strain AE-1 (ATCC 50343)" /LENGTH=397 /DNA_ID=CAMNT_0005202813 /DNA_START=155 /DNA_END=1345 /DNA_ORIENTATION=+
MRKLSINSLNGGDYHEKVHNQQENLHAKRGSGQYEPFKRGRHSKLIKAEMKKIENYSSALEKKKYSPLTSDKKIQESEHRLNGQKLDTKLSEYYTSPLLYKDGPNKHGMMFSSPHSPVGKSEMLGEMFGQLSNYAKRVYTRKLPMLDKNHQMKLKEFNSYNDVKSIRRKTDFEIAHQIKETLHSQNRLNKIFKETSMRAKKKTNPHDVHQLIAHDDISIFNAVNGIQELKQKGTGSKIQQRKRKSIHRKLEDLLDYSPTFKYNQDKSNFFPKEHLQSFHQSLKQEKKRDERFFLIKDKRSRRERNNECLRRRLRRRERRKAAYKKYQNDIILFTEYELDHIKNVQRFIKMVMAAQKFKNAFMEKKLNDLVELYSPQDLDASAIKIQAIWRGVLTRRH